jgi:hypothetical protein
LFGRGFQVKNRKEKDMSKIVTDINELSVFEIEQLAKVLRFELVINNGNEIKIVRKEK